MRFGKGSGQRTIREVLEAMAVPEADIQAAEEDGTLPLLAIQHLVFAEPPTYDAGAIADEVGLPQEQVSHFWRALGFPDPDDDEVVFTDTDLEMMRIAAGTIADEVVDPELALQMARVIGSSMSRVATAQLAALAHRVVVEADEVDEPVLERTEMILEVMPRIMDYVWRRHLQDEARRQLMRVRDAQGGAVTIGFADLVGFTALSQQVPDQELAHLVARFEAVATDTVAGRGGRVVKMIGDEVMFMVDDPAAGAGIALDLADAFREDEALSDVRVGLALGSVIEQDGDVYGPVVNLASRIVGIAYPGSVVVSEEVREALRGDPALNLRSLRSHTLRDIGRVRLWRLRRERDVDPDSLLEKARLRREVGREWIEDHFGPGSDGVGEEPSEDVGGD
jgi:adenylate cyclase